MNTGKQNTCQHLPWIPASLWDHIAPDEMETQRQNWEHKLLQAKKGVKFTL